MSSNIRPASLEDIDAIMKIEQRSFPVPWEYATYLSICTQNGRVLLNDKGMLLMDILEDNQKLTGYAVWETDTVSKRGHILNLAITAEERRKGYGRLLIGHIQDSLRYAEMTSCYLEVRESNTSARLFYETSGYTVSGRLAGYYFDEDAIEYSRNL